MGLKINDDCVSLGHDTVGPLPPPSTVQSGPWAGPHMPYAGTYLPHTSAGYAQMPFNYAADGGAYSFAREESASVHSGSGGTSDTTVLVDLT